MQIGIDLMGSDRAPHQLFPAVIQALEHLDESTVLAVFASKAVIEQLLPQVLPARLEKISFYEADQVIKMTDDPVLAVREKKNSSLVSGIRLLKKKQIDAFISCGNTGALIASASLYLPKLPGIRRPALLANVPTEKGIIAIVDIGSSVISKARYLLDFAKLGVAFKRAENPLIVPTVGLLNIGVESKKGTIEVRHAYDQLMIQSQDASNKPKMKFLGNIEARDVFKGPVDVLVCDGFSGNVLLKTAQGIASFIFEKLNQKLTAPELSALQKQFDYSEYPGAIVIGVEAIVMKVHGSAPSKALYHTILGAESYLKMGMICRLKDELSP